MEYNIFTCCNGIYTHFVPIFIFSHLYHNPDAFIEVCWDNSIDDEIYVALKYLNHLYPNKFLVRSALIGRAIINNQLFSCPPNTNRFIETPYIKTDFVYISDVDIICTLGNIKKDHVNNMKKTGSPYSNIVRPGNKKKLSGLHFTPYDNYYPIPDLSEIITFLQGNDECFLYELIKKRYPEFNNAASWRPVHGIHASPNRQPDGEINWGIAKRANEWIRFRNSKEFLYFENISTPFIKNIFKKIDDFKEKV